MMSPDLYIPTIAELERVIDEHLDVRERLRRKLLTDEERQLPQLVAQLTEQVNKLTQTVAEGFAQAAADRAAISQEMAEGFAQAAADRTAISQEMAEGFAQAAADRTAIRREMAEGFAQVDKRFDRLEGQMDNFRGNAYETKIAANVGSIARPNLNLRNVRILKSISTPRDHDLDRLADQAEDDNRITESENTDMWLLDLIFTGHRRPSPETVYVAAEISITAGDADINRAAERARTLRTALENATVIPAIVTENVAPHQIDLAEMQGVTVLLHPAM